MATLQSTSPKKYQSLYRFLRVLEGQEIHKLYKVVMGTIDSSAFTPEEIRELEHRVTTHQAGRNTVTS